MTDPATPPDSAPTEPTPPAGPPAPTLDARVAALEAALQHADGVVSLMLYLTTNQTIARALAPEKGRPESAEQFRARVFHELAGLKQTADLLGFVRAALAAQGLDTAVIDKVIAGYVAAAKGHERRLALSTEQPKSIVEK